MNLQKLFNDLNTSHKDEQERNKLITPDFNAFQILSPKETQLSKFVGALLNPKGKHAQGRLFLDLFINGFLRKKISFKNAKNVDVSLEYPNKSLDGQIDIFILFDNKFAIAIENKPFADDQERQIMRYCDFMEREYGEDNFLMIYLSADGSNPTDKSLSKDDREKLEKENKFLVISYPQIRDWVNKGVETLKETGAERLSKILVEFAEYINLEFRKQNELKNTPMRNIIKENILDAHQVVSLWNDNYKEFKKYYAERVNQLFNEELPKLVYEDLRNRNVIDDNWEYQKGNFDFDVKHLQGWLIKKKAWNSSGVGVFSTREGFAKYEDNRKGSKNYFPRAFYPTLRSKMYSFKREHYNEEYCNLTGCKKVFDEKQKRHLGYDNRYELWWSYFPDNNYHFWSDENYLEVKPNGKTVIYISLFLEKLIKACEADIDEIERVSKQQNQYSENKFRNFVNQFSWIFAKTYANKAPHEYIVLSKVAMNIRKSLLKLPDS